MEPPGVLKTYFRAVEVHLPRSFSGDRCLVLLETVLCFGGVGTELVGG